MHVHTHKFYTIKKKPAIIEFRRVGTIVLLGEEGDGGGYAALPSLGPTSFTALAVRAQTFHFATPWVTTGRMTTGVQLSLSGSLIHVRETNIFTPGSSTRKRSPTTSFEKNPKPSKECYGNAMLHKRIQHCPTFTHNSIFRNVRCFYVPLPPLSFSDRVSQSPDWPQFTTYLTMTLEDWDYWFVP